ncbi:ABC transporter substrate-binding protein [Verminephrobacter eiseniae]|uniref:ABC transporter substrate-binding protein n=1 Tax=Verminephrobacter eiseniae TaxID=364317 RepID=UPI0010F03442|nr:extracellular solute-binding protein [Verminephrobacter eiseniae]KAB7619614.1 extracellular solute-binding protein [Verminephrobacter sp. Larva24]MCW5230349.1 extracellular solute-binding protein [Verminephrobacter eiseniae]MCW5292082.1 extracellular solute-binding protein [Verminephrobacter eiseniae]MCW8185362.1 extracellular solute-binding protein [Verminephrobacter eiseniae]MCW8223987.1 extracellular solute-binding protein [Verminephrobacter eiseniae]
MNITRARFLKSTIGASLALSHPLRALAAPTQLKGTVTYLTYESLPTTKKVIGDLFAEIEAANPGLKIKPLFTSPEAVRKQVSSMLQSRTAPDIVNLDIEDALLYSRGGLLAPINPLTAGLPDAWRVRPDGKNDFFVPNGIKFTYSWYRTDLFEKAGLQPPKTWDEYERAAAKLTGGGQYGCIINSNTSGDNPVSALYSYAMSNGVTFFDDEGNLLFDQGENRKRLVETLAFLQRMSKYSPSTTNFAWADVMNSYASGKIAMADYIGARFFAVVSQNNAEIAKVTKPFVQPYGMAAANRLSAEGYMVFKDSQNVESAKAIIHYLREGQRYYEFLWSIPMHVLPVAKKDFEGPYQANEYVKSKPEISRVISEAWDGSRNPVFDLTGKKPAWQRAKVYTSTIYNKMLANVIQGGIAPDAAVTDAAQAARALLKFA